MSHLPAVWTLVASALLVAGCGGGGAAFENDTGGGIGSGGATVSFAVVLADVDLDGASDVLEIPVGVPGERPDEPPRCWRGTGEGTPTPAQHWSEHPAVDAIRRDLSGRTEQDILDDEGAHSTRVGGVTLPYAVMHLEAIGDRAGAGPGLPTIDALHPESAAAGALVGIRGTGLAARDEDTTVSFDALAAEVLLALPRFVLVTVPDAAPLGLVDVVVARGTSTSDAASFEVVAAPTPVVTSVHPNPVVPGVLAVVRGEHLGTPADDVTVTFGGTAAERVLPLGRRMIVEVPEGAVSGTVIVTVNGVAGAGFAVDVDTALDAPTLTSVTPASASPGSLVEIAGDDLFVIGQRPRVDFGTARAAVFGRTRESIVVIVPADADGDVVVSVGGRTSNALAFTALARGTPTITSITPAGGAPGELVAIAGTDLYDLGGLLGELGPAGMPLRLPRVRFGERPAFFAFPTPEGLRVLVPFGSGPGVVDVTVEWDGSSSNAVAFTVE